MGKTILKTFLIFAFYFVSYVVADFTTIWAFVEREFKGPIPTYIKNVLKYCGYENCYTISTIEESDLEYIQTEVRKGDITKFFEENRSEASSEGISLDKILEGWRRPVEEFEFSRGHQKFIMLIANLVKENLNKNGVNGFAGTKAGTSQAKRRKPSTSRVTLGVPSKRRKHVLGELNGELVMESNLRSSGAENLFENLHENNASEEDVVKLHQKILVKKAMESLISITPKMYEKVSSVSLRIELLYLD